MRSFLEISTLNFIFKGGGLGSQDIVAAYEAEGKVVKGMQQYDMTVRTPLAVTRLD